MRLPHRSKRPIISPIEVSEQLEEALKLQVREPTLADTRAALLLENASSESKETSKSTLINVVDELSMEETEKLLNRLPPIKKEHEDQKDFFMREKSLKPPLTAEIVQVEFPPQVQLEKPKELKEEEAKISGSELTILRYSPEGELDRSVPSVTITFSQPMVPVSSVSNVENETVPVEISPLPKKGGKFKWLGTKTLVYEANYRFDMSTKYTVSIKKDTTSQIGGVLKNHFSFSFETPRLYLKESLPGTFWNGQMPVNEFPVFYAEFDQEIEPSTVLSFISTPGRKTSLILDGKSSNTLLKEHIKKMMEDYNLNKRNPSMYNAYKSKLESAPESRHLWFTIDVQSHNRVAVGSNFDIAIKKGVVGTEGPLPSVKDSVIHVPNYPPFVKEQVTGGDVPMSAINIRFSNAIDEDKFLESMITVSPPIQGMELDPSGSYLTIRGKTKGRTTYKIFLKSIVDVWGQTLEDTTVEVSVGSARQSLQAFRTGMTVLDPTLNTKPTYPFVTVNMDSVRCVVCQVEPSSYTSDVLYYNSYNNNYRFPGKTVLDTVVTTKGEQDEPCETEIDLTSYLQYPNENLGHLMVYIEPTKTSWKGQWEHRPVYCAWIQATKISLDCVYDPHGPELYFWINSLSDGSIIKQNVEFIKHMAHITPDPLTGIGSYKVHNGTSKLIAKHGNDMCFIPDVSLYASSFTSEIVAHIFNDRGLYKPNEMVSIKGIVRKFVLKNSSPSVEIPDLQKCTYTVTDARGQKYSQGEIEISKVGTFDFTFKVPDNANLGDHSISFSRFNTTHSFKVQEFRTPEFKSSSSIPAGNYIVNGTALCTTKAEYYSGGGISGGKCSYVIKQTSSSYVPPNQSSYTFGEDFDPYMYFYRIFRSSNVGSLLSTTTFEVTTDSNGEHQIAISFEESSRTKKVPVTVSVEANVQDINRQTISSSTSFLIHPCKYYCGIKLSKQLAKPNIPVTASLITTDIDGKLVSGIDMKLTVTTSTRVKKGFKYTQETLQVMEEIITSSKDGPSELPVKFEKGGCYTFKVEIVDPETGLSNSATKTLYVSGGSARDEKLGSNITKDSLLIVPDKSEYQVGEKAKLLIQSNHDGKSEGIALVSLYKVIKQIPVTIDPEIGCTEIEIDITEDFVPNFNVTVEVSSSQSRVDGVGTILDHLPKQPAYASGACNIPVSKITKTLTVETKPEREYLTPGSDTFIDVVVRDPLTGEPIKDSEVCIIAVDEAVLSLTGYSISNPLNTFIRGSYPSFSPYSLRSYVFVKNYDSIVFQKEEPIQERLRCCCCSRSCFGCACDCAGSMECCSCKFKKCKRAPMEGSAEPEEEESQISVRSNFNPLAVFSPKSMTDEQGKATVRFKLPDNLTKYRITAVALKGECKFGIHESSMVAQLPLAIRPSLPRFLNFGDRAEFCCVLQSQVPLNLDVNAAINFTNLTLLDSSKKGLKIKLPAMGRVELRFPMCTERAGIARFQIGVSIATPGINFADAVEKEVRVFTPATTEAFATYGEMDGDSSVFQPVKAPQNVFPQFGALKISTSSTALSSLTDSFLYLYGYPFECCEQIASRVLSIVALKDILLAFNVPEVPSKEDIDSKINSSLSMLASRQYPDGGFGYWTYNDYLEVSPYVTCHVAHALARCKLAGYSLNTTMVSKLVPVLKSIERYCVHYGDESIRSIKAYAYYTLALLGETDAKELAEKLYQEKKLKGNLEYLAWLATTIYLGNNKKATTIVNEIMEHLIKNANETAQTANFVTSYGDIMATKHVMLHSDRRTDGICLEALINMTPQSHLIPKIVKGLLAHKKKGRWSNTQENVFILLALNTYFNTFENVIPDFVANIWLGEEYCGEQVFKGRSKDENQLNIPMSMLINGEVKDSKTLAISKKGPGRLYYRIGMDYAPKDLKVDALDYGFEIQRTYEHVTNPSHVTFDQEKNTWRFKAGELVRIKMRLTNTSRRYHVALVDFLPAGLEPINPELKGSPSVATVSGSTGSQRSRWCWWNPIWYEHHNIRDERVEAFSSLLWEGTHEFTYIARATSIGSFVIPGVKAEEMYTPEIFGRSATEFAEVYE
nr:unnamed protein product [Naegleria fowleri]